MFNICEVYYDFMRTKNCLGYLTTASNNLKCQINYSNRQKQNESEVEDFH
jgi:hypothetical protein